MINFAKVPAILKPQQIKEIRQGNPLSIEPIMQIEIPPKLLPGFIDALTSQKEKYEKRLGPIKNTKEKK